MKRLTTCVCYIGIFVCCAALPAAVGQTNFGSDGSDGVFQPQSDLRVDLSKAARAIWNSPSTIPGEGVYDADKWAVVYKYSSVTIPAGVTVTFTNHPKGAPVVWLVQGDVTVEGTIVLDGRAGDESDGFPLPGPGGFCGGRQASEACEPTGGFGPGGACHINGALGAGGGYATQGESASGAVGGGIYGNEHISPLIGGSGGSAGVSGNGGAGGGAILIAANGRVQLASTALISARGGGGGAPSGGGGAGGAVRLMAQVISGEGRICATGGLAGGTGVGDGGQGRIRLEAGTIEFTGISEPERHTGLPDFLFPPNSSPVLRLLYVNGNPAPSDPTAGINTADLSTRNQDTAVLTVEAYNIPTGTTVTVHVKPEESQEFTVVSTPLAGSFAYSTATVEIQFPKRRSEIFFEAAWGP